MNRIAASVLVSLIIWSSPAFPKDRSEDEVRSALERLRVAFESGDAEGAIALASSDLLLIHPSRGNVSYADYAQALRATLRPVQGKRTVLTIESVIATPKLAVVTLSWSTSRARPDGTVVRSGEHDQEVWRKDPDRKWRLIRGSSFPVEPSTP